MMNIFSTESSDDLMQAINLDFLDPSETFSFHFGKKSLVSYDLGYFFKFSVG